jgi:hypothetical protein
MAAVTVRVATYYTDAPPKAPAYERLGSPRQRGPHDGLERLSEKRLRVRQLRSAKTACPHSVSSFHDISK